MSFLLDTNIISERLKLKPDENLIKWINTTPSDMMYISVLTLGEIKKGIAKLDDGKRKNTLTVWLEHDVPAWFEDRILSIDTIVAERWGHITASSKRPISAIDGLIAATALVHNLTMVTRNTSDFTFPGLDILNPWDIV